MSRSTRRRRPCCSLRTSPLLVFTTLALLLILFVGLDVSVRILNFGWNKPFTSRLETQRSNPAGQPKVGIDNNRTQSSPTRLMPVVASVARLIPKEGRIGVHLDHGLNPRVTTTVQLRPKAEDDFDKIIFDLMGSQHIVIHQTWKDRCILDEKIPIMKTWLDTETSLKVVFWTDASMDLWMLKHLEGTEIYEAWRMISKSQGSHIKRADFFRYCIIYYYGGIYVDLDVGIHHSMRILLQEGLTILVWEPETAMEEFTKWKKGDFDRTLMLSGIVASGIRESDFLGYLVNWISANYVSLRHGNGTSVLDATGPKACAEAYRYYIGRLVKHDPLLRVISYEEFESMYGYHRSTSTWIKERLKDKTCTDIGSIYPEGKVLIFAPSKDR